MMTELNSNNTGLKSLRLVLPSVCLSQVNEGVAVVSLPDAQTLHVQGVIQTTQPSVIQSPQIQTVQVHTYRFFMYVIHLYRTGVNISLRKSYNLYSPHLLNHNARCSVSHSSTILLFIYLFLHLERLTNHIAGS